MSNSPYSKFDGESLILRDELAIDRTLLANERTLLAYLRSGVALFIAGISIIHFVSHGWFQMVGIVCLPAGLVTAVLGVLRYQKMNAAITMVRKQTGIGKGKMDGHVES
jgi:putative membrane protein